MIFYSETKNGRKSIYSKVITDENDRVISTRQVEIPLYKFEKDGKEWFLLYDDDMNILVKPTLYLNFTMADKSIKTRNVSAAGHHRQRQDRGVPACRCPRCGRGQAGADASAGNCADSPIGEALSGLVWGPNSCGPLQA